MFFVNLFQNIDQLLEKYYVFITRPRLKFVLDAYLESFEYKEAEKFAAYEKKEQETTGDVQEKCKYL
jgi:hypothetical protein